MLSCVRRDLILDATRDAGCDTEELLMSRATTSEETSPISGLEVLRLGGALLVTAQHALTLTGHEDWSS